MTHKANISEALTRHQAIKVAWNAYVGASMDPANTNLEAMSAAIDAYDALYRANTQPAKVKPLEWTDYRKFPDEPWSETMLRSRIGHHNLGRYAGSYSVFETAQGGPWGWKCSWISDCEPEAVFPTEAEAIAACQDDYNSRIRSALITNEGIAA